MAKFYPELNDQLRAFIARQHLFLTATAAPDGRINLSPKGVDGLRCIDDRTVAYLDLTGSGNETAAHLLADGRITLMCCSFETQPLILRIYGRGRTLRPHDRDWPQWSRHFPALPGTRQIIVVTIESVQTSCGYGVPLYDYAGERGTLRRWAEQKGEPALAAYRHEKNRRSIDGLPTEPPHEP